MYHCWRFRLTRLLAVASLISLLTAARAQDTQAVPIGPPELITNRQPFGVWLTILNPSATNATPSFPASLPAKLLADNRVFPVTLALRNPAEAGAMTLGSGRFVRREYLLTLPRQVTGTVLLTVPEWNTPAIALQVQVTDRADPVIVDDRSAVTFNEFQQAGAAPDPPAFSPGQFFKEHFFGYEPFYFIAGPESPNAKLQISLRYQLLNRYGMLAQKAPFLKGLNFAYTQRSLWDLSSPSSPFLDSSYMPEMFYLWQQADGGRWADGFRLDLQGGAQHESNGKGGTDSRSLNILYFRPTVVFGRQDGFQFKLSPRVWAYVGDLDDNPDLPDYRGYVDLRATLGWSRHLQFSTTGRMGKDGDHGSLQFDLTYPMMRLLSGSFSLYLHAQYFTGYGESLLFYNQRSDGFRVGFSLFR